MASRESDEYVATVNQYLYGKRPQCAIITVVAVGVATGAILIPFGLFEIGFSGPLGSSAFAIAFGVLPGVAGGICGWYRLGFPAVAGSGTAPGVVFYLVVAVGTALNVGSFGGGDSPLGSFTLVLTIPSVVAATVGFVITVTVARLYK